jgi:hypothetical protein
MAVQTIYILGTTAVGPNWFGNTQLNGSAPAATTTAFGWVPAKTATSTPYFRSRLGATAPASDAGSSLDPVGSVNAPTPGTGSGAATAGDCFIAGPFNGTFANSTWTFNWNLRASIAGCVGLVGMKIYRSVNANGSPASQVKSESGGTTVTLSTTADTNSQIVWNPGATVTLNNEYLFFQLMWQETTQGSTNGCNVFFRTGTSFITTPDFVYTPQTVQAAAEIDGAGGALASPVRGPVAASALIAGTGGAPVNYIINPLAQGAVVGSPGTMPYAWIIFGSFVTQSIVASGVLADGTPYVDIRHSGTPTGPYSVNAFSWGGVDAPNFGAGVPLVLSAYVAMVGGSMTNITDVGLSIRSNIAPGGGVFFGFTPTATLTRYSFTLTTPAIYNGVSGGWQLDFTAGLPIDITLRFALPQLEIGTVATAPILPAAMPYVHYRRWERGIFANASGGRDVSRNSLSLLYQPGNLRADWPGDVGVQFTAGAALTFNRIGIRCPTNASGLHTVFLRDVTAGTLVQAVAIDLTGGINGVYYYGTLTQITLVVGHAYYLGTNTTNDGTQFWTSAGVTSLRGAVGGSVYSAYNSAQTGGSANPTEDIADCQYYGLDLDYVPPPVTANALVAGLGGATNWIRNPRLEGAVAGTPGTAPSDWGWSLNAGVSAQITGTGTEGGLPYVDLRIYGTTTGPTNSLVLNVSLVPPMGGAINGDTWVSSVYLRLMAGSLPTGSGGVRLMTYLMDGSLGNITYSFTVPYAFTPTNAPLIQQRCVSSGIAPIDRPDARFVELNLWVYYDVLQPVDFTLRIASPQLERNSLTAPIWPPAGAPQVSTRALQALPGVAINASALIAGSGGTINWIRNPRGDGGTPGILGAGGVLPPDWFAHNAGGITCQYLGQFVVDGIPVTRWRYSGTTADGGVMGINPAVNVVTVSGIPPNCVLYESFYARIQAGTTAGIQQFVCWGDLRDANNTQVPGAPQIAFPITGTLTRFSFGWGIGSPGVPPYFTNAVGSVIYPLAFPQTIDFTIDIGGWQFEYNSVTPLMLPPAGSPQATARGLIATPTPFTPVGATINGTGNVRAFIAPVAVPTGAVIAGQGGQTNYIRNPRAEGAVAGTPGTLPTFWSENPTTNTTRQIVGSGIDAATGLSYLDIRLTNTAPGILAYAIYLDTNTTFAAIGDTFVSTCWIATVGGSSTGVNSFVYRATAPSGAAGQVNIGTSATLTKYTVSMTATAAGVVADPSHIAILSSVDVDITLRIAGAQFERGLIPTPLILPPVGAPQVTTRALLAMPTIFGSATLGGVGSVTANAYTLAQAGTRIDARGSLSVDGRVFIPTGAQIDGTGGRINYIQNPRGEGGAIGTIGFGGVFPTNYDGVLPPGLTFDYLGQFVVNGIPVTRWRWYGTTTNTSPLALTVVSGVGVNGLAFGSTQAQSWYWRLVAGSTAGISAFKQWGVAQDATATQVGTPQNTVPPPGAVLARVPATQWNSFTSGVNPFFVSTLGVVIYTNGAGSVIDMTLDFGGWQFEPLDATSLMLPPVGAPGATRRAIEAMPVIPAQAQATIAGVGSISANGLRDTPGVARIGGQGGQTNYIRNPRAEGAVVGTPGTLPTFWSEGTANNTTRQVVGSGVDAATGLSYVDVRLTNTAPGALAYTLYLDTNVALAAIGDTFVSTCWIATVGGSSAGLLLRYLANGGSGGATGTSATLTQYTVSMTATVAGVFADPGHIAILGSDAVDITLRIAGAQFERGLIPTPPILPPVGAPQISTRALLAMPTTLISAQATIAGVGGATNWVRNPQGVAATSGIYPPNNNSGSPYWWDTEVDTGLQKQIVGAFIVDGVDVLRLRVWGTPDPGTDPTWAIADALFEYTLEYTGGPFLVNIQEGQPITQSFYLRLVAGDWTNVQHLTIWNAVLDVTNTAVPTVQTVFTPPGAQLTRYTNTYTQTGGVAPYAMVGFGLTFRRVDPTDYIDVTFDIGGGQVELGSRLTSLILPINGLAALLGIRGVRGIEAQGVALVQAAAQINGEGLIGADSSFVGQARANATIAGVGNIIIAGLRQWFAARAAIHGTGSVAVSFVAKEAVRARLLGVGGVQATAAVAHPTIARIRGVGGIQAVSQRVRYASATIAGTGRLFATGFPIKSGNVTIGGAGLLRVRDTIIAVLQTAAATITGTAAVHVQGRRAPPCDGLIEAEGTVYATATVQAAGQALVAGAGTVDAHGIAQRTAAVLLNGEGAIRGLLNSYPISGALLGGDGQVAADGTPIRQTLGAAALIAGVGRVRADAFRAATVAAEAMIAGLGAVLASGLRAAVVNVDKTIAGVGSVRASVTRVIVAASATINGTGTARANGSQIGQVSAEAQIDGSSWLRVDSVTVTQVHAAATIQGVGGLAAHAARSQHARATIAGASNVTARGSVWAPALAMIAGAGALVAGHRKAPFPVHAKLGGAGSVRATAHVLVSTHVRIAGHATVSHVRATLHAEAQVRISVHGWLIERAKSQLEAHVRIVGQGHIGFDGEQLSHHHTSARIGGVGQIETDASKPREQIASQGVYLPPQLVGVSVL